MIAQRENYYRIILAGLIMTLILFAGLSVYSLREDTRLARAAEDFTAERNQRGEEIYGKQCAACHGADGGGGVGPALNNRTLLNNTLDNVFFSVIRSGVPGTKMPAWSVDYGGPLTDEEVRDVVAFVRAWEAEAPEIQAASFTPDPTQGAVLFSTTCAVCHGENGQGGEQAPRLNDPARLAGLSDDWYRQVIRNGRQAKGMPTWGTVLSPNQIGNLVALIDAWRSGREVQPDYLLTDLLDNAIFALEGDDPDTAALHVKRALAAAQRASAQEAGAAGPVVEALQTAAGQIEAGDLQGALDGLQTLQSSWPLGDPGAGAANYSANCSACHGPRGEGGVGVALQNNEFIGSLSNAELVQFLLEGRPGTIMAGFQGRLDEDRLADIVALLRLWQDIP